MKELIEKITAPLKANPDLANPKPGSYSHGYKSAIINVIAIINDELASDGDLADVTNCKNYTRTEVIEILCKLLESTGIEIKATMKNIRTNPYIEINGADFDKWVEANV